MKQHAERAAELLGCTKTAQVPHCKAHFGLDLAELIREARAIADGSLLLCADGKPDAERRLPLVLRLVVS